MPIHVSHQGKDIEGPLTPVHEKVIAVKKSIAALVGKMESGGDQLNWYSNTCYPFCSGVTNLIIFY